MTTSIPTITNPVPLRIKVWRGGEEVLLQAVLHPQGGWCWSVPDEFALEKVTAITIEPLDGKPIYIGPDGGAYTPNG